MKRIRVSGPAALDLDDIWYYIAKNSGSIETATRIIDSITATFSLFAREPEAGARRDEIESGLRGFPAGNYIVCYRTMGQQVVIARVIHGMRDPQAVFLHG